MMYFTLSIFSISWEIIRGSSNSMIRMFTADYVSPILRRDMLFCSSRRQRLTYVTLWQELLVWLSLSFAHNISSGSRCAFRGNWPTLGWVLWHSFPNHISDTSSWSRCAFWGKWTYGEMGRRSYQNVVIGLRREFRYGVTTADEGLCPISPSKLKYPPHPSGRRYQTNQETLFSLVMFIWLTCDNSKAQPSAHGTSLWT